MRSNSISGVAYILSELDPETTGASDLMAPDSAHQLCAFPCEHRPNDQLNVALPRLVEVFRVLLGLLHGAVLSWGLLHLSLNLLFQIPRFYYKFKKLK